MTRRIALVLGWLLATVGSLSSLEVPKPEASITGFRLEALTLREVTFSFELTVKNPYPVELPVAGLTLDFLVEGSPVFHTENQGSLKIPARKSKAVAFQVTLPYAGVMAAVTDYDQRDWLQTVVQGKLSIALPKLPGVPKSVSFDYKLEKKIPALKPQVTLLDFHVEAPSEAQVAEAARKAASKADPKALASALGGLLAGRKPAASAPALTTLDLPLTLTFTLAVENQTRAALGFQALAYALAVNDEALTTGQSTEVRQEGTRTLVTVVNTIRTTQLSAGLQRLFVDRSGSFRVSGTAQLVVPPEVRPEPVPLALNEAGTFRF